MIGNGSKSIPQARLTQLIARHTQHVRGQVERAYGFYARSQYTRQAASPCAEIEHIESVHIYDLIQGARDICLIIFA